MAKCSGSSRRVPHRVLQLKLEACRIVFTEVLKTRDWLLVKISGARTKKKVFRKSSRKNRDYRQYEKIFKSYNQ